MNKPDQTNRSDLWTQLLVLTAAAAVCYLVLLCMGPYYARKVADVDRPMLWVIGIYAAAFVPCWLATRLAARMPDSRRLVAWVLGSSVLFRVLMLPTPPFQEIDIYRYLWDGAVLAQGESPYRYSLDEIKQGIAGVRQGRPLRDQRLEQLATLAINQPGLEEIVRVVHYAELPSPYPPVSQVVFAAPALVTPADWSATARLNLLKLVLTLFDVGTLLLLLVLLKRTGLPLGLAVAYGWCPLVMKETAGSGHLDSITTFFAIAALVVGWIGLSAKRSGSAKRGLVGSAVLLALGVAGKLFPVVLAPLMFFAWGRRIGWASAAVWAFLFVSFSGTFLAPMLADSGRSSTPPADEAAAAEAPFGPEALPPAPGALAQEPAASEPADPEAATEGTDPTAGLSAFLSRWEMNDLAFMVVVEHLRPNDHVDERYRPWFVAFEDPTSQAITESWNGLLEAVGLELPGDPAFLLARLITVAVFGIIALTLAWRATKSLRSADDQHQAGEKLMRAAFLTLAWFWLLAPTQNPWYWCWAVPLLPFARLRTWHVLAACSLLYYTRFWLLAHFPEPGVLGTPYDGKFFFYFVIAWVEFLPWMLALAIEAWLRRAKP